MTKASPIENPKKLSIRLITNTIFFTIFGYQIAKLSEYFLPDTHHTAVLALLALWFAGLSWIANKACPTFHRRALHIIQGVTLSCAQYLIIFHGKKTPDMLMAMALSFIGINLGLLTPWLSHTQPNRKPLTYLLASLTPFIGIIIGHTLAIQTSIHLAVALIIWPISISTIQFIKLNILEKPVIDIPAKHTFYWLNIGWFWISVVGYLFSNTLADPLFFGVCFLLGFMIATSLSDWQDEKSWHTNSAAIWLSIQGSLFIFYAPSATDSHLQHALYVILFGALSCKFLIPSISRLDKGSSTHVTIGNLAWLFFAFAMHPYALKHHFLTGTGLITLLIINGFITDTRSNFLAMSYACMQFVLHRIGIRYQGTENIAYRPNQRVLMVANHSCFLDVPIIASRFDETLTYPIYPFWLDVWVIRVIGGMFAEMHAMKPGQSSSLANVIHAIRKGSKCLIFPEGRLTDTGNLMKIFEGAVILAEHAKAHIQPVIINGGMNLVSSRDDFRHVKRFFAPVNVTFGPCTPLPETTLKGKTKRKFIKLEIYKRLTETYMHSFTDKTICEALNDASRRFGKNRLAIRNHDFLNDMTYHALLQKAKCIAARLKKTVHRREVLAITINHGADTAALMFACFMLEIIVLPIDQNIHSDAFKKICQHITISAIVIDDSVWTELSHEQHYDCLQQLPIQIIEWKRLNRSTTYVDKLAMALQPLKISQSHPEAIPALLWFDTTESSTTLLSQHNLCQQAYQCHICCDLQGQDVVYNTLPLNSSFSMLMGLLHPLLSGTPVILTTTSFSRKNTIEAFYDTQASVLITDKASMEAVLPQEEDAFETLRMRTIFCDGQPDEKTRAHWESHTKSYLFSVWTDPNNAGIIAMNTPCYHDTNSQGQLLPLTKPHHNKQDQVVSLSGPICPDFTYEKSPIAYRKQTSATWPLAKPATITPLGFVCTDDHEHAQKTDHS